MLQMNLPMIMICFVIRGEKIAHDIRTELQNITQVSSSKMLGVSSQSNNSFNEHIKVRIQETNKCLRVI